MNTRDSVRSPILYEIIGKRLVASQQIRFGLKLLRFIDVLVKCPELLEPTVAD